MGNRNVPGQGDGIDRARAWLQGIALGALGLAALVIAFVIGTNYSDEPTPGDAVVNEKKTSEELPKPVSEKGRELFVATCGSCHVLSEAETTGAVGPDLDTLAPDAALVESAIANGGSGTGAMPPHLLKGKDAAEVSEYVSAVAGN
ncbi:MAG: cytochrome c [Solirubrobacterales bacterium]|nr:cytochrome c [Solirubrobacterales bacterium]